MEWVDFITFFHPCWWTLGRQVLNVFNGIYWFFIHWLKATFNSHILDFMLLLQFCDLLARPSISSETSTRFILFINLLFQVFVGNSTKYNEIGHPFGYLKASTSNQTVNLFVMPYNYPQLIPLLGNSSASWCLDSSQSLAIDYRWDWCQILTGTGFNLKRIVIWIHQYDNFNTFNSITVPIGEK